MTQEAKLCRNCKYMVRYPAGPMVCASPRLLNFVTGIPITGMDCFTLRSLNSRCGWDGLLYEPAEPSS